MNNRQKRLIFYTTLAVGLMIFSQLLSTWWVAELFSHFCFFGAIFILIAALWMKTRIRYALILIALPIIIWGLLPLSYWATPTLSASAQHLLVYNVEINNDKPQAEIDFIQSTQAEILLLAEAGGQWQSHLNTLTPRYPYGCGHEENSPFALKALSQQPLKSCQVKRWADFPFIRLETTNKHVIYALHPPPPINRELAKSRKDYLLQAAEAIQQEIHPTLVVGDLNNTAFSPLFRDFVQQAGLKMHTYRALPTWKPLFLPIDHVLSRHSTPQSVQVTPLAWQYSDHRPLLVRWSH